MAIRIAWDKESLNVIEYRVYKDTTTINTVSPPAPVAQIGANDATTYIDADLDEGVTYYFVVSVVAQGLPEIFSNEIVITADNFNPSAFIKNDKALWIEATGVSRIRDFNNQPIANLSSAEGNTGILIDNVDNINLAEGGIAESTQPSNFPNLIYDDKFPFFKFSNRSELRKRNFTGFSGKDYGVFAFIGKQYYESQFDGNGSDARNPVLRLGENTIGYYGTGSTARQDLFIGFENDPTANNSAMPFDIPEMKPLIIYYRFIDGEFDVFTSDGSGGLTTLHTHTGGSTQPSLTVGDVIVSGEEDLTDQIPVDVDPQVHNCAINSVIVVGSDTAWTTQEITDLCNYLLNKVEAIA